MKEKKYFMGGSNIPEEREFILSPRNTEFIQGKGKGEIYYDNSRNSSSILYL